MSENIIAILLVVNSLLILVMLLALLAVLRQGRRVARIARDTQRLEQQAEAHPLGQGGDEPQSPPDA